MQGTNAVFTFVGAGEPAGDRHIYENSDAYPAEASDELSWACFEAQSVSPEVESPVDFIRATAEVFAALRREERGFVDSWAATKLTSYRYEVEAKEGTLHVKVYQPDVEALPADYTPEPGQNYPEWTRVFSGTLEELVLWAEVRDESAELLEGDEVPSPVTSQALLTVDEGDGVTSLEGTGAVSWPTDGPTIVLPAAEFAAVKSLLDGTATDYSEICRVLGIEARDLAKTIVTGLRFNTVDLGELPDLLEGLGVTPAGIRAAIEAEDDLESIAQVHPELEAVLQAIEQAAERM